MDAIVVAPNSAIDSYYELDRFAPGSVQVAKHAFHTAGGKGLNLARALKYIGGSPFCLGLVGGAAGRFIQQDLDEEGISSDLTWTTTESRRCVTLRIPGAADTTVILERGGEVDPSLADALSDACLRHVYEAPFTVLTGSLASGFPVDFYARLVTMLKPHLVKVGLDAAGESLKLAAQAGPSVIKVNRLEFEQTFLATGERFTVDSGRSVFDRLIEFGLETLVVTDGANGATIFLKSGSIYRVQTKVDGWVSTAGAGDTFLAAMIYKHNRGGSNEEMFTFASAAAAATMQALGCGILNPELIPHYAANTSLEVMIS